jgi:hypothetical protein
MCVLKCWYVGEINTMLSLSPQYHQHSTCSFYVRKLHAQLFCAYILGFVLYWRKTVGAKAAGRMLVKLNPGHRADISSTLLPWWKIE